MAKSYIDIETKWRESGFLALIQCYPALPDFPVNVAADMLELGRHCQGDFPPDDRDVHSRLAQESLQHTFFPLAYFTKSAIEGQPAFEKLRSDPGLAQASSEFLTKLQGQYRTAKELTVHQLHHAILIAFLRQMGEVIMCLKAPCINASSTANGDSSGSEQE